MKFMTTWTIRPGEGSSADRIAEGKKLLEAFGRWTVPEGESILMFVTRADGKGGVAISESDNVYALADAAAKFEPWFTWEIVPVMDLTDNATIEFLISTSGFHD